MHTTALRKVGGSTMLVVPSAFLDQLEIKAGSFVEMAIDHGKLVVVPRTRRKYTLEELLAQCDESAEISNEDKEWLNLKPVGLEII